MKIVSACLCGVNCNWEATNKFDEKICELVRSGQAVMVCPEQMGGMTTPRPPCEQIGDRVFDKDGNEYTKQFDKGAREVLELALRIGADEFIGKRKSPSCGVGLVSDGTFSEKLVPGDGVTAKLLKKHRIKVSSEY